MQVQVQVHDHLVLDGGLCDVVAGRLMKGVHPVVVKAHVALGAGLLVVGVWLFIFAFVALSVGLSLATLGRLRDMSAMAKAGS